MENKKGLAAETVLVVLMATVVGFVFNAFSPDGLPVIRELPEKIAVADSELFGDQPPAGGDPASTGTRVDTLRTISLDQLRRVMAEKRGMIIDARTPDEYAEGYIGDAVNMYAMEPENYFEQIVEIPRDSLVVVYCGNPQCHFARSLADFFTEFGFTNILLYDEGWDGWQEAGMPVTMPGGSTE